jgi:hypothetical protein
MYRITSLRTHAAGEADNYSIALKTFLFVPQKYETILIICRYTS